MTQLLDLDDDCLLEVLDRLQPNQLFNMLEFNRRLRRTGVKYKAIDVNESIWYIKLGRCFADCAHLGSITQDQKLSMIKINQKNFLETVCLNVLPRLADLKAIDFMDQRVSSEMLEDIVQHCPQLECLKIGWLYFVDDDWERFLDRIGEKIVHFTKHLVYCEYLEVEKLIHEAVLLEMIVAKCVNIKRLDWVADSKVSLSEFKNLPKDCWVGLNCYRFNEDVYEDVVDEMFIHKFDWYFRGNRVDRLSTLKLNKLVHADDSVVDGINFTGLKTLDFSRRHQNYRYIRESVECLMACQFPFLQEFSFNIFDGFEDDDFYGLFYGMKSISKLNMVCSKLLNVTPELPGSAIRILKNLETISFEIYGIPMDPFDWQPKDFIQELEQYIDEIESLKKLTIKMRCEFEITEWCKTVEDGIERLKAKQNRVEIDLVIENERQ